MCKLKIKYTDYCTCFKEITDTEVIVHFYDEIKDQPIQNIVTSSEDEADNLMSSWVKNAPLKSICQHIQDI